ncbi:MAG: hypothetical protein FJY54_13280 [Betaproteobacteria bacterium]|nr:hypothetical protein [Betaproteobacteria bacterium]
MAHSLLSWITRAVGFTVLLAGATGAYAQPFPTKPVRLVVTFPPGGPTDFVARTVGDALVKTRGQHVVVDSPFFLFVNASVPADDVKKLLALAQAQPGKLSYGSVGQGSATHLAFELLRSMAKIEMLHVPYKGTAPLATALLANEVQAGISSMPTLLPHVRAGRLRVLGVGTAKRSSLLPEVPTISEAGVPGYLAATWYGIFGPARMPRPLVEKIHAAIAGVLAAPATRDRLASQGLEVPARAPPAGFAAFIKADQAKWRDIIRTARITAGE